MREAKIGDRIKILFMKEEHQYSGKEGEVTIIDDIGQIHGTWGGCAIIPEVDNFIIINDDMDLTSHITNLFEEFTAYAKNKIQDKFFVINKNNVDIIKITDINYFEIKDDKNEEIRKKIILRYNKYSETGMKIGEDSRKTTIFRFANFFDNKISFDTIEDAMLFNSLS